MNYLSDFRHLRYTGGSDDVDRLSDNDFTCSSDDSEETDSWISTTTSSDIVSDSTADASVDGESDSSWTGKSRGPNRSRSAVTTGTRTPRRGLSKPERVGIEQFFIPYICRVVCPSIDLKFVFEGFLRKGTQTHPLLTSTSENYIRCL